MSRLDGIWNARPNEPGLPVLRSLWQDTYASTYLQGEPQFVMWLSDVLRLPYDVRAAATDVAGLSWSYPRLDEIAEGMSGGLILRSRGKNPWLNELTMQALAGVSEALDTSLQHSEKRLPDQTVDRLLALVGGLLTEMAAMDDLPVELRRFATESLTEIQRALIGYRIEGFEGLRRALDLTWGVWARTPEAARVKAEKTPFGKKVLAVVATFAGLVQFSADAIAIYDSPSIDWGTDRMIVEVIETLPEEERPAIGPGQRALPRPSTEDGTSVPEIDEDEAHD